VRRGRFGLSVVVLCLAAGCSQATTQAPVANDQADVWFLQHMVPYLRQTMVVASLTREQLGDPRLVRLADAIIRQSQAEIDQLQGWTSEACRPTATATSELTPAARPTWNG
jgi:uncharacterized protein (DUF305 family)